MELLRILYLWNIYSFALSKLNVSSLKKQYSITIPKSELQPVVLKRTILEERDFNIHKIRFETDSKISLSYIWNSSVRFLIYIMNHLHEIKINSIVNE